MAPRRKKKQPDSPAPVPSSPLPPTAALRLVYMDPAELAENPGNWRRHPESQLTALTDVLAEVGWAGACLFNERTGRLIDGHARRKVALDQGAKQVPVLVGDWSPEQEALILATLDPIGALATADGNALAELLAEVNTGSAALSQMLTDLAEASGVIPCLDEPAAAATDLVDDFDASPAEGPTRAQPGDLWVIGGTHRLLVADCTDPRNAARLMGGSPFDALVCDPPYSRGGAHRGDRTATTSSKYQQSEQTQTRPSVDFAGDNKDQRSWLSWCERWLAVYLEHARPGSALALFIDWRQLPALTDAIQGGGWIWRGIGVWDKTEGARPAYGRFRAQCEYLLWGSCGPLAHNDGSSCHAGVIRESIHAKEKEHLTQKPLAVAAWSLSMLTAGGLVVDPFLGSGTTLIAAHRLGATCYGAEIEPRYADVILRRAEAEGLRVEKE